MQTERDALIEQLLESYTAYFDVTREEDLGGLLKAVAAYHSFMEKYVLTRKAKLWAAHAHEYILLFSLPRLDMHMWETIRDYSLKQLEERVTPDREHMYTYITPVILADVIEDDAAKAIKRYRFYKSFRLSFYGWSTVRLCALEVDTGKAISNYQGKDVRKFVNKIYKERTK